MCGWGGGQLPHVLEENEDPFSIRSGGCRLPVLQEGGLGGLRGRRLEVERREKTFCRATRTPLSRVCALTLTLAPEASIVFLELGALSSLPALPHVCNTALCLLCGSGDMTEALPWVLAAGLAGTGSEESSVRFPL